MDSTWTQDQFFALDPFYDLSLADIEDRAEMRKKDMKLKAIAKGVGINAEDYKSLKKAYFEEIGMPPGIGSQYDRRLARFHEWNSHAPVAVIDDAVREQILKDHTMILVNGKLYLYGEGVYEMDDGEIRISAIIKEYLYPKFRTAGKVRAICDLLRKEPTILTERTELNAHPVWWINVRNGMLDLKTLELHPHDPSYKSINQIPWEYDETKAASCMGAGSDTALFLTSLIPNRENLVMFLQYAGYCMTTDMSLQRFMIIRGEGGTGKSVLLRMVERMVGEKNYCNMTMQNLNTRFAPAFLAGKVLNVYADLPSSAMEESNGIKTITGGDTIQAEYKGGDLFFFRPYCKLLFSANTVPKSLDDKTSAYYRRLLILPIERRAMEIEQLEERLEKDASTFFHMCIKSAHEMYLSGRIYVSDDSTKETDDLRRETDSVKAFLDDCTIDRREQEKAVRIERGLLYSRYATYCQEEGRTIMSKNNFYKDMREKGFEETKYQGGRFFRQLELDYAEES